MAGPRSSSSKSNPEITHRISVPPVRKEPEKERLPSPSDATPQPMPGLESIESDKNPATLRLGGPPAYPADVLTPAPGKRFPEADAPTSGMGHTPDAAFPELGTHLLHFELIEHLGRGAFARVYLARQESLANRLVVVKVTTEHSDEPQNLARLRHTNIVPVYSVHETGRFQVLCMPYLGRVTLSRGIASLLNAGSLPTSGRELLRHLGADSVVDHELTRLSYVDGCLWVIGQLAAGLSHAHRNGILHRDIKPGNVLFTEDGQPMLLDFNVAGEVGRFDPDAPIGGTVPYMAPEHLHAFIGQGGRIDHQCDLYSLGVILYELLTGERPFPLTTLPSRVDTVKLAIARRATPPTPLHALNPAVTPAVEAIVARLLETRPEHRYPSAEVLRADIARQLSNQPLEFAPDPSVRERVGKWRRRHSRLVLGICVAVAATLLLAVPAVVIATQRAKQAERERERQRVEAAAAADSAMRTLRDAAVKLGSQVDHATRDEGLRAAHRVVEEYHVTEPDWQLQSAFARLDPERQKEFTQTLAEVLVLLTRAEASAGGYSAAAISTGLKWNALAAELFPQAERPAILDRHRAELEARRDGRAIPPAAPPTDRDTDLYYDGLDLTAAGRHREALPLLVKFCDRHTAHFRAWFARGMCHTGLNQPAEAVAAFTACLALQPDFPDAYLNRGVARFLQGRYADADSDFTRALELRSDWQLALMNRGRTRFARGQYSAAETDYAAALNDSDPPTRLYFLRADARLRQANIIGVALDRAEGMWREPTDALSWAVRGRWRMFTEPQKAIADFDAAIALDPDLDHALLNKAIVLADVLHREADAIPLLNHLLELHPDKVDARCSRGVYLARLGRETEAKRDATASLAADNSAYRKFQIAGLYAQLSKKEPKAKDEALRYLALALRGGFTDMGLLTRDTDLDPIRNDDEFKRLVKTAGELAPRPRKE